MQSCAEIEQEPSGSGSGCPQSQIQRPTVVNRSPTPAQAKKGYLTISSSHSRVPASSPCGPTLPVATRAMSAESTSISVF
ncbi:MAG: hypothetical protein E6J83_08485 [Deltaproteobacteria bacterium]|nr:MAG: hypothetical protein E6J83_08485 [Deltaproteobacteria bacterium]